MLKPDQEDAMDLVVKGMTCGHCEAAVQGAVKRVPPEADVVIGRTQGRVSITGAADAKPVESAIRQEVCEVYAVK